LSFPDLGLALNASRCILLQLAKARVKLSIKQLYRADGYAVKELLKIASLLYEAVKVNAADEVHHRVRSAGDLSLYSSSLHGADCVDSSMSSTTQRLPDVPFASKLDELKGVRQMATDLVECGSRLHTLLAKEEEMRVRNACLPTWTQYMSAA